jgi:hypothetical protein
MTLLDPTQARADYIAYLMTTPYSISRTYPAAATVTGLCAFGPQSGTQEQAGDQILERGDYQMTVAVDADVQPTDRVTIGGRVFKVVWTPPPTELSLGKQFGLEEVRRQ